jgi:hypothetical protein
LPSLFLTVILLGWLGKADIFHNEIYYWAVTCGVGVILVVIGLVLYYVHGKEIFEVDTGKPYITVPCQANDGPRAFPEFILENKNSTDFTKDRKKVVCKCPGQCPATKYDPEVCKGDEGKVRCAVVS